MFLRTASLCTLVVCAATSMAATAVVKVFSFDFGANPPTHSDPIIELNDTVSWLFVGGFHTTTSAAGQSETWNSGFKSTGNFDHTFTHLGSFSYFCSLHGSDTGGGNVSGMSGRVFVANTLNSTALDIFRGKRLGGAIGDLATSNDQYLRVEMGGVKLGETAQVVVDLKLTSSVLTPAIFAVNLEDKCASTAVMRRVEIFNNQTNSFEAVGSGTVGSTDTTLQLVPTGPAARFVNSSDGAVRVRLSYSSSSTTLPRRYSINIDRAVVLAL